MPISVPRLRIWFASLAVAVVAVVAGFYLYARWETRRFLKEIPAKLGIEIQQSTQGFSLSKSAGGRTIFTIRAANAVQYSQGGRAELKDVTIVVYGREGSRFDQIYGADFEYDPQAGTVSAKGEVLIDLEGNAAGPTQPDQATPRELQNPIHLKTSGLVFNQKSGLAHTDQRIEFRVPQGEGSAMGASYDTKENVLVLESRVSLRINSREQTSVEANHGTITKDPRRINLDMARVRQPGRDFESDRLTMLLSAANEVERVIATGNVRLDAGGEDGATLRSPQAELLVGEKDQLRQAVFSGGVKIEGRGAHAASGTAGRVTLDFGPRNTPRLLHASENVYLRHQSTAGESRVPAAPRASRAGAPPQSPGKSGEIVEITCDAADMHVRNGKHLSFAESVGPGRIVITPTAPAVPGEHTVITAGRLHAEFDDNRLSLVRGEPNAKVIAITPGEPDKTSTSDSLLAQFAADGSLSQIRQDGNFRYNEPEAASGLGPGGRFAYANNARYSPDSDVLTLSGSPRVVDGGMTITANALRIDRRSGDAFAQGAVKTTYSELQQNPAGAILATSDPVHVTSDSANVKRETGVARYTGEARLWQGANVVEAPAIEFDRPHRSLVAQGTAQRPVTSVFVQTDQQGKTTSVVVTAARLVYNDSERRARYTGGVTARGGDLTLTSTSADVLLAPASERGASTGTTVSPSRLNQIIALGKIDVRQQERTATGDRLVYTAADEKFVLTGGPPLLSDPEHGTVRGDSLTFFSRDDRVLVESKESSRTITRTRITR